MAKCANGRCCNYHEPPWEISKALFPCVSLVELDDVLVWMVERRCVESRGEGADAGNWPREGHFLAFKGLELELLEAIFSADTGLGGGYWSLVVWLGCFHAIVPGLLMRLLSLFLYVYSIFFCIVDP